MEVSTGLGGSRRKLQCKVLASLLLNYKLPCTSVDLRGLVYKMKLSEVAFSSNFLCFQL